jgi:hypothetical protein
MHLDWLSTFRISDVAAGHMWSILRSLLPASRVPGVVRRTTFTRIQAFVTKHRLDTVEKIPCCPCGKTIYHDFKNQELRDLYPTSDTRRMGCALCTLSKFLPNTKTPRKVVYFISPEVWLRDLYQRKDIASVLDNSTDPASFAPGSLRRSEGWKRKVMDNPKMNSDHRHAPLVGMADGAPYFKDRNAGSGWFFLLRHGGFPDELVLDPTLAHLTLFISSEHYEMDKKHPGKIIRVKRYDSNIAWVFVVCVTRPPTYYHVCHIVHVSCIRVLQIPLPSSHTALRAFHLNTHMNTNIRPHNLNMSSSLFIRPCTRTYNCMYRRLTSTTIIICEHDKNRSTKKKNMCTYSQGSQVCSGSNGAVGGRPAAVIRRRVRGQ